MLASGAVAQAASGRASAPACTSWPFQERGRPRPRRTRPRCRACCRGHRPLPGTNIRTDYVTYAATAFPGRGCVRRIEEAGPRQRARHARGDAAGCGNTSFGIIGYSQGADAAGDLASEIGTGTSTIRPEKVAAVGLLSDPRRADSDALIGPRVPGDGAGGPRIGGFGWISDRTVTFCDPGDLYCSTEATTT